LAKLHSYEGCPKPLRVVLIRAKKNDCKNLKNDHQDNNDYCGWISNIGEHEIKSIKLIKFYRKGGQAENYIKELKYGYDAAWTLFENQILTRPFIAKGVELTDYTRDADPCCLNCIEKLFRQLHIEIDNLHLDKM